MSVNEDDCEFIVPPRPAVFMRNVSVQTIIPTLPPQSATVADRLNELDLFRRWCYLEMVRDG
jgi:hypothetical protein